MKKYFEICVCLYFVIVYNLIKQKRLLKEEAKKSGKVKEKKAADNILKQLKNTARGAGAFTNKDGLQVIGGAFSAVRLKKPLPVENLPKNINPIDYDPIFKKGEENEGDPLLLPSISELSAYIKAEKAAHKGEKNYIIFWSFGELLPVVNAIYLLDILYLLPDSVCIPSKRGILEALYFKSNNGDAILCPIRKPQK